MRRAVQLEPKALGYSLRFDRRINSTLLPPSRVADNNVSPSHCLCVITRREFSGTHIFTISSREEEPTRLFIRDA